MQVNAYVLAETKDAVHRANARWLVENRLTHYLGSDTHRIDHRPPSLRSGLDYLYKVCDRAYADALSFGNAERMLTGSAG